MPRRVAPWGSWSYGAIRKASCKFNLRYSLALTMQRRLLATHYRSSLPSLWSQKCVTARIVDDFSLKGWIEWTVCNQVGHGRRDQVSFSLDMWYPSVCIATPVPWEAFQRGHVGVWLFQMINLSFWPTWRFDSYITNMVQAIALTSFNDRKESIDPMLRSDWSKKAASCLSCLYIYDSTYAQHNAPRI